MKKQEFSSFQEELEHDYHVYKKRQKIKFIAALPIIIIMALFIIIMLAFLIFGIVGRFVFL